MEFFALLRVFLVYHNFIKIGFISLAELAGKHTLYLLESAGKIELVAKTKHITYLPQ